MPRRHNRRSLPHKDSTGTGGTRPRSDDAITIDFDRAEGTVSELASRLANREWDKIDPLTLWTVLRRLQDDTNLNLSLRSQAGRLSGAEAQTLVDSIYRALSRPPGGTRNRDDWDQEQLDHSRAEDYSWIDGLPRGSAKECDALLARELLLANRECKKTGRALRAAFRQRLEPRIARARMLFPSYLLEKLITYCFDEAAATIGAADAATPTGIDRILGLTARSRAEYHRRRLAAYRGEEEFNDRPVELKLLAERGLRKLAALRRDKRRIDSS